MSPLMQLADFHILNIWNDFTDTINWKMSGWNGQKNIIILVFHVTI